MIVELARPPRQAFRFAEQADALRLAERLRRAAPDAAVRTETPEGAQTLSRTESTCARSLSVVMPCAIWDSTLPGQRTIRQATVTTAITAATSVKSRFTGYRR